MEAIASGGSVMAQEECLNPLPVTGTNGTEATGCDCLNGDGGLDESALKEVRDDVEDLLSENQVLQKRVLALQRRRSTIGTQLFFEGIEGRYQNVAFDAEHRSLKKHLSRKLLETLQFEDEEEDEEIEMLKIEARQTANRLKKVQQALEKKDVLPDGLSACAFEQLKVENETLHRQVLAC